jgi:hypothetical protein
MYYIIFASETVVFDDDNQRIIATPTESEAEEYIAEQEES